MCFEQYKLYNCSITRVQSIYRSVDEQKVSLQHFYSWSIAFQGKNTQIIWFQLSKYELNIKSILFCFCFLQLIHIQITTAPTINQSAIFLVCSFSNMDICKLAQFTMKVDWIVLCFKEYRWHNFTSARAQRSRRGVNEPSARMF